MMHIIIINNAYGRFPSLQAMLTLYYNLTGWAEGVAAAGAQVTVFQRYQLDTDLEIANIPYHFITEHKPRQLTWQIPWRIIRRVRTLCQRHVQAGIPTVVHMNGFVFPIPTRVLRLMLPNSVPIVVQHHGERAMRSWKQRVQRAALRGLDGYLFAAKPMAQEWLDAGIIASSHDVYDVMEGSSLFTYQDRASARAITGLTGNPILFWAGNLDSNKDPLTILNGFERILPAYPDARLYMAYRYDSLLAEVQARIARSQALTQSVTLLGQLAREQIPDYFNSADFFVQGSAKEGSGLAVLDALTCGVVPVITDIPSFRVLTDNGRIGALWPVGDEERFVAALRHVLAQPVQAQSAAARQFFEQQWSFAAIGRRALQVYEMAWQRRQEKIAT
ncbi:MAG: glycosyltransferase family 4 protein [Ardenticatenaceae bacterium]|nr:glycosyltransferase family 4 protein [Ardenticatenaceae bacterium]